MINTWSDLAELVEFNRHLLNEDLSFADLLRVSDPKRAARAHTVKGPPLKIDSYENSTYYGFNFKAYPSTTGLRHHGYIKFKKPNTDMPIEQVHCEVDCDCQDYRYRWAWVNKQKGAGQVGPTSVNKAWNQAPVITNPEGRPGLCKHIIALKDYLDGQMASDVFAGAEGEDVGNMLADLVRRSDQRLINYDAEVEVARSREQAYAAGRSARRKGEDPSDFEDVADDPSLEIVPDEVDDSEEVDLSTEPEEDETNIDSDSDEEQPRVESVDRIEMKHLLENIDELEGMEPEGSEALELLTDIRDGINVIAGIDDGEGEEVEDVADDVSSAMPDEGDLGDLEDVPAEDEEDETFQDTKKLRNI